MQQVSQKFFLHYNYESSYSASVLVAAGGASVFADCIDPPSGDGGTSVGAGGGTSVGGGDISVGGGGTSVGNGGTSVGGTGVSDGTGKADGSK